MRSRRSRKPERSARPTKWSDSTRTCATNNNKRGGQLGPLYLEGGFPGGDRHPRAHQHLSRRGKKVSAPQQSDRASPFSSRLLHLTNYNDRLSTMIARNYVKEYMQFCITLFTTRPHAGKNWWLSHLRHASPIFSSALDFVWFHFHGSYRVRGEFKASNLPAIIGMDHWR